ncbi:type II toxin-antitoxin system VapC family toxin [soil metagenome]
MPTTDAILLDTHALLWWQAGSDRLSAVATAAIDAAARVLISPISCWEVAMLVSRRRVSLDRAVTAWVQDLMTSQQVEVAQLTPAIAVSAGELDDFHGDPADRLIYATAEAMGTRLVTKDSKLQDVAERLATVSTVW